MDACAADEESAQHEWESSLHAPVKWSAVVVSEAVSKKVAEEFSQFDSRRRIPGATLEQITIKATSPLHGITAFRLEVLPDMDETGRRPKAVVAEFRVATMDTKTGGEIPRRFIMASAGFLTDGSSPKLAIDGEHRSRWVAEDAAKQAHAAAFQLEKQMEGGIETALVFTLLLTEDGLNLTRLRISATTHTPPVLELPEIVRETIALEPSERTAEQRKALVDLFQSVRKQSGK